MLYTKDLVRSSLYLFRSLISSSPQEMYRILNGSKGYAQVLRHLATPPRTSHRHTNGTTHHGNGLHRHGYGMGRESSSATNVAAEPFLNGSSGTYIEAMYESWQADRSSVHKVGENQLSMLTRAPFTRPLSVLMGAPFTRPLSMLIDLSSAIHKRGETH